MTSVWPFWLAPAEQRFSVKGHEIPESTCKQKMDRRTQGRKQTRTHTYTNKNDTDKRVDYFKSCIICVTENYIDAKADTVKMLTNVSFT